MLKLYDGDDKMKDILDRYFKWNTKELLLAIFGCFLMSLAINLFIVPNHLYSGGILGIAQLLRSMIEDATTLHFNFDISGIISFLLNVPLFILAYKHISKTFFRRTAICVIVQTVFLTIIPIPEQKLLHDLLASVVLGGIIVGLGSGMTLSASGSGGGTDIIGLYIASKNKNFSVGKIGRGINYVIYIVCGILYGTEIMIYSIIYTFVTNMIVDQSHKQNILTYVMIFTKDNPVNIIEFIQKEFNRDGTYWEAQGGYDKTKTYITYAAMSKYEMQRLERHLNELNPNAFMITNEGIGIDGNFEKQLTRK